MPIDSREDVRVVCCDAFKYAVARAERRGARLALLLTTLLAEAPGAEYAQNSHIGNTPELLQPENEMLKNHKKTHPGRRELPNAKAQAFSLEEAAPSWTTSRPPRTCLRSSRSVEARSFFVGLAARRGRFNVLGVREARGAGHGVLPVAVCSHSSVYAFPAAMLREDDRLLVLARQPSDVAAFERWVARNAWEELNENRIRTFHQ